MSAFNPFRRTVDGASTQKTSSTSHPPINLPPDLFTKPVQPPSSQLLNGYPRKSGPSLEIEDDESSSSDDHDHDHDHDQTADPFNPDSSVSDNEDDEHSEDHPRTFPSSDDHSRDTVGTAPHPAPSDDGSSIVPPSKASSFSTQQSTVEVGGPHTTQGTTSLSALSGGRGRYKSPENGGGTNPSSRADKEKKPPPPPRSHHGKRINASQSTSTSTSTSRPQSYRSANRSSFHASSPESVTSEQPTSTPTANVNANAASQPASNYILMPSDNQQASASTDSLQRTQSQNKRPPTPPLSRRHSQMRRSKSTQSKSSNSRLTMSSLDSESTDSSAPPSPGPSTRSVASSMSMSQDRKRVSMPPPTTGEPRPAPPAESLSPPTTAAAASSRPTPPPPGRRASSYGSVAAGSSSSGAPPPPPPRRLGARDSNTREGGAEPQANNTGAESERASPLPQPSNAHDILADLSRLQKEVDDLRGHYENENQNRKVSQ